MPLKINLSKLERDEEGNRKPRHLVLTCSVEESYEIQSLLYSQVLMPNGAQMAVAKRNRNRDIARFHIALRHMDRLKLTFPYADISPGLDKRIIRAARREYEDLDVPEVTVPGLKRSTHVLPHQAQAIDRITKLLGGEELIDGNEVDVFFLDDEMGLGKTFIALAAIKVLEEMGIDPYPVLCVVPNNVKYPAWHDDMLKFFKKASFKDTVIIDSDRQSPAERSLLVQEQHKLTITNPESLWRIPEFEEQSWGLVVVDEYHRFRNYDENTCTPKQTHAFLQLKFRKGLFMSGTSIVNGRPEELWPSLHKAWPDKYPSIWAFRANHLIKSRHSDKIVAYKNLGQIRDQVGPVEMRRRKDQVIRDLPPRIYQRRIVPLNREQRRTYDRILDEMLLELIDPETGETMQRPILGVLGQITRLKQAAFSPELFGGSKHSSKVKEVKEIVAELHANSEKAIIFSQWSKATRILQRELAQYNPAYVDGTVRLSKRHDEIKRFQNDDDCSVFIGTIGSCKEGITLTAGSYVIFTDKGWTPSENEQAAGRAHRIGQTRTVNVIEVFSQDTIEGDIEDLLQAKQNVFNALVEQDGGVRHERMALTDIRRLLEESRQLRLPVTGSNNEED